MLKINVTISPEYKILFFFITKMLILKMVINAAQKKTKQKKQTKTKCSDVFYI